MAKAKREFQEKLKLVYIVLELLDARLPESSSNPMLDQIIQDKPRLKILMKADLADQKRTNQWLNYYQDQGKPAMALNVKHKQDMKDVTDQIKVVLSDWQKQRQAKGLNQRAVKAVSVGIPNVGKSTLINRFAGKNIAQTGNRPGVTQAQQWIKYKGVLELLDTPGILWPKFEDQEVGKKLALTGAIKDKLLYMDDIALYAIDFFKAHYPGRFEDRYQLAQGAEKDLSSVDLLLAITGKRGFGDDYDRAATMIVNEIRKGLLGPFSLDQLGDWKSMEKLTIKDIKAKLRQLDHENNFTESLRQDPRKGVQKALKSWGQSLLREKELIQAYQEKNSLESQIRSQGFQTIAGFDEVGRGPLAGPVVAAAVILDPDQVILGLDDSKKLSQKKRQVLDQAIKAKSKDWAIGSASVQEIDRYNIYQATRLAMKRALDALLLKPDYLLVDDMVIETSLPQKSMVKGDKLSNAIAAASIVAKQYRDQQMIDYSKDYPDYGFDHHVGYGTQIHLEALRKYGPTPIHRQSFQPVRDASRSD